MNKYISMHYRRGRGKPKTRQCNALASRAANWTSRAFGLCLTATLFFAVVKADEQRAQAFDAAELECLAENIYQEARGSSLADQYAVAMVTRNRVDSARFPDSFCGVVYQPHQFSWTAEPAPLSDTESLRRAFRIAREVMAGAPDITEGADHYYNPSKVSPRWAKAGFDVVSLDHRYMKVR